MVGLNIEGSWVEDPVHLKPKVKEFFENKFQRDVDIAPKLEGVPFNQLSQEDNVFLTACFDLEEIKEAVWDCKGDRSPGPDGFNFKFIKYFWYFLQSDFKRVLDDFHRNGAWPKGSNASFLALIQKSEVLRVLMTSDLSPLWVASTKLFPRFSPKG